jgi:hypothetical protein
LGLKRLASLRRSTTHRRQRARRTMKLLVALSLFGAAAAVELTPDNWDDMTDGKTVFIKFLAPW